LSYLFFVTTAATHKYSNREREITVHPIRVLA